MRLRRIFVLNKAGALPDPRLLIGQDTGRKPVLQLSYSPENGGPKWIRTTDPSLIRAVL